MSNATCPRCQEQVRLPACDHPQARVQCPLCQEEYQLGEILEKLPLPLILLEVPGGAATSEEPLDAQLEPLEEGAEEHEDAFAFSDMEMAPAEDTESAPAPFSFSETAAPQKEKTAGTPGKKTAPRPAKKKKSPAMEILKVAGGGIVGIVLAVLIMWWGLGKDPFKIAPAVGKYVPFLVPARFQDKENSNTAGEEETEPGKIVTKTPKNLPPPGSGKGPAGQLDDTLFNGEDPFKPGGNGNTNPQEEKDPFEINPDDLVGNPIGEPEEEPNPPQNEPTGGLKIAKRPTAADLSASLKTANEKNNAWDEAEETTREEKIAYYTALADLSENVTLIDPEVEFLEGPLETMRTMLLPFANQAEKIKFLSGAGVSWIKDNKRKSPGLLLPGTVMEIQPSGEGLFEIKIKAAQRNDVVRVLTNQNPITLYDVDAKIILLGVVVDNPQDQIEGYQGENEAVVWSTYAIELPL